MIAKQTVYRVMWRALPIVVPAVVMVAFGACTHNDGDNRGPAEKAGAAVDSAGEKVSDTAASGAAAVKQKVHDATAPGGGPSN